MLCYTLIVVELLTSILSTFTMLPMVVSIFIERILCLESRPSLILVPYNFTHYLRSVLT